VLGQKVNPIGFRLGIYRDWDSRWFAGKEYPNFVFEDYQIRKFLKKRLVQAGVSRIEIERAANKARIKLHTARPGLVIGKKGVEIENVKRELEKKIHREVIIDIQEVRKPEVDAQLIAENVALQLVRRVSFRRAMKKLSPPTGRLASKWLFSKGKFYPIRKSQVDHAQSEKG
jgi:small subunit ribosomal protein S3